MIREEESQKKIKLKYKKAPTRNKNKKNFIELYKIDRVRRKDLNIANSAIADSNTTTRHKKLIHPTKGEVPVRMSANVNAKQTKLSSKYSKPLKTNPITSRKQKISIIKY